MSANKEIQFNSGDITQAEGFGVCGGWNEKMNMDPSRLFEHVQKAPQGEVGTWDARAKSYPPHPEVLVL